jgi:predicted TIM-barrel fold metal-dependent hydrolase
VSTPPQVDAHLHMYRSADEGRRAKKNYVIWEYGERADIAFTDAPGDLESTLAGLSASATDLAIVVNLHDTPTPGADLAEDLVAYNRFLCDSAARHPELVPFIAVDPATLGMDATVAHIRDMVSEHGARGIKLHPPAEGFNPSSDSNWRIFETCRDVGIGIVSHAGPSRTGPQYGEPNSYRPLLTAFPDLLISLAHLGGAAWRQTAKLARDFPNIYFDLCEVIEWTGATRAPTKEQLVELIRAVGSDRVMMGSDFPWYDIGHTVRLVRALPGLSDAEKRGILGENALRFLGRSGSS